MFKPTEIKDKPVIVRVNSKTETVATSLDHFFELIGDSKIVVKEYDTEFYVIKVS